jgi:drug/metabolite transporter (DMT)-like permease
MKKSDIKYYIILGMIGMAGSNYFYYISIKYITVATAIMLQYTTPFIVLIYSIITRTEKYHYVKILLLLLAFIALFFAISSGDLSYFSINIVGVLLGISAAFTWAFFNIYNKMIKNRYNNLTELLYITGSATLLWFCFNPGVFNQLSNFKINDLFILIAFAMLSVLIPMFLYNSGLKYLRATQATTIGLSEPVIVVFSAFFIIHENISTIQAISGVIVLILIFLLEKIRNKLDNKIITS